MSRYVRCGVCQREVVLREDYRLTGHGRRGAKCPGSYESANFATLTVKPQVYSAT